jgi:diacylglycerol kinase family enzyme
MIDVGAVIVNRQRFAFVAHVIARSRGWSGPVFAVMNSEWLGDWIVAPRAHPGDGYFDLVEARLSVGDRIKARRRLPTGTHVPHPAIHVRKITTTEIPFGTSRCVYVDGEHVGTAASMQIECHREALHAYV